MSSTFLDAFARVGGATIVVTGAARSQGAAEARMLAEFGARVIATDVVDADGALDDRIAFRHLDVTDEESWARLAGELTRALGGTPLHGLINNAGVTHRAGIGQTERADWDRVLAVNLTGPMLGMRALAPVMGDGSSIVNVGSVAGLTGHYTAAYTASKPTMSPGSPSSWWRTHPGTSPAPISPSTGDSPPPPGPSTSPTASRPARSTFRSE